MRSFYTDVARIKLLLSYPLREISFKYHNIDGGGGKGVAIATATSKGRNLHQRTKTKKATGF